MAAKPCYLTTAIAYPNGPPHIGFAYEVVATDAIARFMRLDSYDVFCQIAILAQPFIPASAGKLLDQLGVPVDERDFATLGGDQRIEHGVTLPPPSPVFPRYVDPEANAAS